DMSIDIGAHEQWARGFEVYLMEGKSPSVELRSVFEKFRQWLITVYRKVLEMVGRVPGAALGVRVSDEMREVFARMMATDEEIQKAQEAIGSAETVFATAEQLGMTPEQWQAFLKAR